MKFSYHFVLFLFVFAVFRTISVSAQSATISDFGSDADKAVQQAFMSGYDTIVFNMPPSGSSWVLGPITIGAAKDKTVLFEKGVDIRARSAAFPDLKDALFKFINCENINIVGNGSEISMLKNEYADGEWRHAISIRGSRDISISNLTIRDSGGDGIYIAGYGKGSYSENISIKNIRSLNNKRQGISIISGKNILIEDCEFSDTKGTFPGAGIDIEPNNKSDLIDDIVVRRCIIKNNYHSGIKIALSQLTSTSADIDILFEDCVLSNNHAPENPKVSTEILIGANKSNPVGGILKFNNCMVEDSRWGVLFSRKRADGFHVEFNNFTARKICQDGPSPAIGLEVPDYHKNMGDLGGFTFNNMYLEYDVLAPVVTIRGSRKGTLEHLRDLKGTITVKDLGASGNLEHYKFYNYQPSANIDVDLKFQEN